MIKGNGRGGGGSLNLAGLQDSLIQNNLIYGNLNHGIAQWDNDNPFDAAYAEPGPQTAGAVTGPDDLPLWGCHGNVIRNNTVLMANAGRAALQALHGSWGGRYGTTSSSTTSRARSRCSTPASSASTPATTWPAP